MLLELKAQLLYRPADEAERPVPGQWMKGAGLQLVY
jgi:hypothetical protein